MAGQAVFTPGPRYLFVAFPSQGSASVQYLGTCVVAPEVEGEKFKLPVMNDLSGRSVPFQLVEDGEIWQCGVTLNRFNLALCRQIAALDSGPPGSLGGTAGTETGNIRGTLVIGVNDFQLVIVNGYAGSVAAGSGGAAGASDMAGGRAFSTCNLRKYREDTKGTRVLEVSMAIDCQNLFSTSTRGFKIYGEDVNASQYLPLVT